MTCYYNDTDPFCQQWLRNLMATGEIPRGDVDARDIRQVETPGLTGYATCHFFAGIGGWPLALRLSGWPDDVPVWTGSCPCQPFSSAGRRQGRRDARHLWPRWLLLIAECRPAVIFGEQVASKAGREWLSGVRTSLEVLGYAVGLADLCAACLGAPHIRQRLFWVAIADDANGKRSHNTSTTAVTPNPGASSRGNGVESPGRSPAGGLANGKGRGRGERGDAPRKGDGGHVDGGVAIGGVGHASGDALGRDARAASGAKAQGQGEGVQAGAGGLDITRSGATGGVGDAGREQRPGRRQGRGVEAPERREPGVHAQQAYPDGPWADAYLVGCADGKCRRVGAGLQPLAHGIPRGMGSGEPTFRGVVRSARRNRVGRLRGYGNAIVPQLAAAFVRAVMEATDGT
jgi:DNA (cytosine-5)-methyltransferase 1